MKNALTAVNLPAVGERQIPTDSPSFTDVVGASLDYKYGPFMDAARNGFLSRHIVPDEGYNARENIPEDLRAFGSTLLYARNSEDMTLLTGQIRRGQENRRVLYEAGFVANMAAEFFDPVNYASLPFSKATTFGRAFLDAGVSTAAIVSAQELIRAPIDPNATAGEAAMNIGSSFVLGGLLGAGVGAPARGRAKIQRDGAIEIDNLRKSIEEIDGAELDPNIAQSVFTDSWLFTGVTTPMKRILTDQSIPNSVKLRTLTIANDSGILLAGNKIGQKFGNSVFQEAKLYEGEWVGVYDELLDIWGQTTGNGTTNPMDYMAPPQRKIFNEWLVEIDEKAIRRTTPANELESRAIQKLNTFYENWEVRLRDEGMIGSQKYYETLVARREGHIVNTQRVLNSPNLNSAYRSRLEGQLTRYADEIDQAKQTIQDLKDSGPITPPNEGIFRPRYLDLDSIRADREGFAKILIGWFSANPSIYARDTITKKFQRIELDSDAESISKRVNDMIDNILDDPDPLNPDGMYYGMGKSKHMQHRTLDIPNELVLDFMVRNPATVMKAYVSKTAARYEFSRKFNGSSIDDILDDTFAEMMEAGSTPEKAYAAMKDMRHLYDRVAGSVLRSPDSLNQKVATVMRDLAQLNFLGSAGLSTITEPAKIIMEHGLGPTMKGLFNILTDNQLRMGAKELRIAGEALENINGSAHMRLVDDLNNNPLRTTYMDTTKNAFYLLNGLAPITRIMKDFDGMMRSHTLIDYSVRWTQGRATKMEQEYLLRYNINLEDAQKIADSPWEKSSSGMYMANTEAWASADMSKALAKVTKEYKKPTQSVFGMTEEQALERFSNQFYVDRIITDQEIVDDVFNRAGTPNILGTADGIGRERPASIYLNLKNIRNSYNKLQNRDDLNEFVKELDDALESGLITEAAHAHQIGYTKNIDILSNEDEFAEFVLMHELHHTTTPRNAGETLADYETRIDELAYSYLRNEKSEHLRLAANKEFELQTKAEQENVRNFRNALSSGVMNTILMGTPADKPIITDGIVYIPMRVAKQFGMKEDAAYKGYARIENGLLGLPFQFFSFALAAVNKTTAAYGHGQLKSQYIGTAIAMGLGYMTLQAKTPDYVEMSYSDQFARSFDYSGVAALYSDMFYTAMTTVSALGGPNITGDLVQPKFPQQPDTIDAVTGLMGAGPSISSDLIRGMWEITTGNVGEGSKDVIRNLPFARLWFLKAKINEMTNMLEGEIDGPSGFGRF